MFAKDYRTETPQCDGSYKCCLHLNCLTHPHTNTRQLFTLSSCPASQPSPTASHRPLHSPPQQLAEPPVTLATRPGSCPAPLARLKSCHFLIDSGLSFCLCSRFPIWQWSQLFSARASEKRKRANTLSPRVRGNLRFKWVKQKRCLSPMVALCSVGLLILKEGKGS